MPDDNEDDTLMRKKFEASTQLNRTDYQLDKKNESLKWRKREHWKNYYCE